MPMPYSDSEKPRVAVVVPPGMISYTTRRVSLYFRAVLRGGALPFALPLTQDEKLLAFLLSGADGLLITGGRDIDPSSYGGTPEPRMTYDPDFDRFEIFLFRSACEAGMPVLGICRGMQIMNVVTGGTLIPEISGHKDGVTHPLTGISGMLGDILGVSGVAVNSFHHQAVGRLGNGFRATAFAPDGCIEGVEDSSRPFVVGVQWHPERGNDPGNRKLFQEFIRHCSEYGKSAAHLGMMEFPSGDDAE